MFQTYILQSARSGIYYVGHTNKIAKRLERHNAGMVKSNRNKGPWLLVYFETFETRLAANRRELAIKSKKSRTFISHLINDGRTGIHVPTDSRDAL